MSNREGIKSKEQILKENIDYGNPTSIQDWVDSDAWVFREHVLRAMQAYHDQFQSSSAGIKEGGIWVRASERLPGKELPTHFKIYGNPYAGEFFDKDDEDIQIRIVVDGEYENYRYFPIKEVEWLDESESSSPVEQAPQSAGKSKIYREALEKILEKFGRWCLSNELAYEKGKNPTWGKISYSEKVKGFLHCETDGTWLMVTDIIISNTKKT